MKRGILFLIFSLFAGPMMNVMGMGPFELSPEDEATHLAELNTTYAAIMKLQRQKRPIRVVLPNRALLSPPSEEEERVQELTERLGFLPLEDGMYDRDLDKEVAQHNGPMLEFMADPNFNEWYEAWALDAFNGVRDTIIYHCRDMDALKLALNLAKQDLKSTFIQYYGNNEATKYTADDLNRLVLWAHIRYVKEVISPETDRFYLDLEDKEKEYDSLRNLRKELSGDGENHIWTSEEIEALRPYREERDRLRARWNSRIKYLAMWSSRKSPLN
jgi:hypothetical protein